MSEWKECTLAGVASYRTGKLNSNAENPNGIYPFFTCSPITLKIDNYAFDEEALLLAGNNANGVFSLKHFKGKFNAYQRTYIISVFDHCDFKFLFYSLKLQLSNLEFISHGTATKFLTMPILNSIPITLPPLPEQKAIASVLASLDDKIDLLHRQNKTLEAMAETLFRQWFVEEAQEDWDILKLGDCVTISYGKNLPTKKLLSAGYPVFGANGQIGFYERYSYEEPQVLVSCRGEASGKVNISLSKSFVTNNSLVLERNKKREISFEFLKYWALAYDFKLHVSGSAQPQITIDGLYDADFPCPDKESISEFTGAVGPLEMKLYENLLQITTLEKLRDTLLPKLISGEVQVEI